MFRWSRGEEEEGKEGSQRWSDSINALYQHVQIIALEVNEFKIHLEDNYGSTGLTMLSRRFEKISRDFSDMSIKPHHIFYEVIRRSDARKSSVRQIEQQAKRIAKLFERYSRKTNSFSAVDCRLEIDKLLAHLETLETNCVTTGAVD